jgi:lantibiotic modifying enzyme
LRPRSPASGLEDAVAGIARALRTSRVEDTAEASLGAGNAGVALFLHYYHHHCESAASVGTAAEARLAASLDAVTNVPSEASLYTGFSGIGWTVAHLMRRGLTERVDLTEIDDALIERVTARHDEPVDVVFGLAGYGVYFLERLDHPAGRHGLRLVVQSIVDSAVLRPEGACWFTPGRFLSAHRRTFAPDGLYDLGLAHGVPGVIAILAAAEKAVGPSPGARDVLAAAVRWVLSHRDASGPWSEYPYWSPAGGARQEGTSRLAWCYGDLAVGSALLVAASAMADAGLRQTALATLRRAAGRPIDKSGVVDACLCHGAAGITQIFHRVAAATGDACVGAAARTWLEVALSQRLESSGVGGYVYKHQVNLDSPAVDRPDQGFLQGAAGIGLALLSALVPTASDWEICLALGPH